MDFPSLKNAMNSSFRDLNPLLRIYEREWVDDTSRILDEEDEGCHEQVPVCIFTVPTSLIHTKQEAYIPQLVAIGPYHQKRLDLYQMMRYKISSAKRTQKILKTHNVKDVVEHFYKLEHHIRACYHRFIDYSGETLAWTMAIDASFLLEYLQIYTKGLALTEVPYSMSHLLDYTGRKSGHQAILRDILMMENQIPLFVIREFLALCQIEKRNDFFLEALRGFCRELSPINLGNDFLFCEEEVIERAHLLDLLYYTIVPSSNEEEMVVLKIEQSEERKHGEEESRCSRRIAFNSIANKLSSVMLAPIHYLSKAATSKKISILVKLPFEIIKKVKKGSSGEMIKDLIDSAEAIAMEVDMVETEDTPTGGEIQIPSVTELTDVGIKFRPSKGGLNTIKFNNATATFSLPVIKMDEKTDAVFRNLVAYEAAIASENMTLSRYIELMNGIIDTKEDVKLLKESGIIFNHLKSDQEVADLWNGMSGSAKPRTIVPVLDDVIESTNAYYSSKLKVRAQRFMKKYAFFSWKFIIFFGTNIFLLLTALEALCSAYNCKRTISSYS